MNTPVHRNTDSRSCGASTIVKGQSTVYVNNLLVSVQDDPDTHSGGGLLANTNAGSIFVNGKKVVFKGSNAKPDSMGHTNPKAAGGSPTVFGGSNKSAEAPLAADPTGSDLYPDPDTSTSQNDYADPAGQDGFTPTSTGNLSDFQKQKIAELESDPAWQAKLAEMEAKYPNFDREEMYRLIDGESTFDPKAVSGAGATGLFQLMPDSASRIGTTTDQIYNSSPAQQLEYYDQYISGWGYDGNNSLGVLNAAPAYAGRSADTVITQYPVGSSAWRQNPGWRSTPNGPITVGGINNYYRSRGA